MIRTSLQSAWHHRRRLASTTCAIVLGIAFLTGTLVVRDSANAGFAQAFSSANAGIDAVVRNADDLSTGDGPRAPVDAGLADRIARVDGVATTAATVSGLAQIVGADGEPLGGNGPPTLGANWITDPSLTGYRLAEGRAPGAPGEVVIDARSARDGDLTVGSETTVLVPEPVTVTVVGIATFGDLESLGSTTLAAFTLPEAQRLLLDDRAALTSILVRADAGVSPEALVHRLRTVLPAGTEAVTGAVLTAEQEADIQADFLGFFTAALLVFAFIALLVAVFSIFNTFSMLAAQRSREFALLRAIGASRVQVVVAGLVEALVVAAVGTALGVAAGVSIGFGLRAVLGADGLGMPIDGLVVGTVTVGTAVVTGMTVTVAAAGVPALRAARTAPVAALGGYDREGPGGSRLRAAVGALLLVAGVATTLTATGGDAVLAQTGIGTLCGVLAFVVLGPIAAPVAASACGRVIGRRGVAADLAWRNVARSPRRTAGTAAALLVGVSVVSLFTVFASSVKESMDSAMARGFSGDVMVVSTGMGGAGLDPALATGLADTPGVAAVAALSYPSIRLDGTATDVTATDLASLPQVAAIDVVDGDPNRPGADAFGASRATATARGWNVGDRVTASFPDGTAASVRLAYLYDDRTLLGDVVFPAAVAAPHVAQENVQLVAVAFAPGVDASATRRAVDTVVAATGNAEVQDADEFVAAQSAQVDVVLTVVYALLVVAIGIAGMGIANTLSLSIHERTRELGLLRAVGVSRRQIRSTVRWEAVIIGLFGATGGVAVGVFGGWAMIHALAVAEGLGTFALPVVPLVVILVSGALLGVLASVRPARRAARLDVLDAIATT